MGRVEYKRCLKTDLPTYMPWRVSAGVWPKAALDAQLKRAIKAFAVHSWRWQRNGAGSDGKKPPRHNAAAKGACLLVCRLFPIVPLTKILGLSEARRRI